MAPVHDTGPPGERSLGGLGTAAFILFLIGGLAAGLALRHGPAPSIERRAAPEDAAAKPNVVVVMTDDQTLEQMRALPRTRKLIGTQGVKFKRFYVTDPLCCPSRATFLTGQYAHNTGVISNGGPNALAALDEDDTLGVWLQRAGYRTAFVGKYLNGYGLDDPEQVPPGWSEWRALLEPSAQDYFDYDLNEDGVVTHYGTAPEDYKTRVLGHLAVDAIRHAARGDRPLFLYVGFNAPHAPSTPAPRDAGSLEDVSAPRTPAFDEDDLSDKPSFLRDRPPLERQGDRPHRRSPPARARVARRGGSPGRPDRRRAARQGASSATPTSSSPPTTATSTASTGSSSGRGSPTSRRAGSRC